MACQASGVSCLALDKAHPCLINFRIGKNQQKLRVSKLYCIVYRSDIVTKYPLGAQRIIATNDSAVR